MAKFLITHRRTVQGIVPPNITTTTIVKIEGQNSLTPQEAVEHINRSLSIIPGKFNPISIDDIHEISVVTYPFELAGGEHEPLPGNVGVMRIVVGVLIISMLIVAKVMFYG